MVSKTFALFDLRFVSPHLPVLCFTCLGSREDLGRALETCLRCWSQMLPRMKNLPSTQGFLRSRSEACGSVVAVVV